MTRKLSVLAFCVGLAVIGWVGAGYVTSNPLAFCMTILIAACYVMGGLELRRFHSASVSLVQALASIPAPLTRLADWIVALHPSLQNAVRQRVEGERVALPGPAMTPYLVGLLVLLGMLGTFLGMVVTLNGAVTALESTADIAAIRAALAAPVKGLGVAFGTSVAGVAASAMLGLISALCRRERQQAAQALDTQIAGALRGFSLAHQREETLKSLQQQAQAMPEVVGHIKSAMSQLVQQGLALNAQLLANQEGFQRGAQNAYSELASSVDQSLRRSLQESAQLTGTSLAPVLQQALAGMAQENRQLQAQVAGTVQQQLESVSKRLDTAVDGAAAQWDAALTLQRQSQLAAVQDMQTALSNMAEGLEARTSSVMAALGATVEAVSGHLSQSHLQQQQAQARLVAELEQSLSGLTRDLEQRSTGLLTAVSASQEAAQRTWAERDAERLAHFGAGLEQLGALLQSQWQTVSAQSLSHQAQICATLEQTAAQMQTAAAQQATTTVAEVARLMHAAAEAPRAAAELVGQLREQLSASMVRDNGVLEERARILSTMSTLLDSVNHAATEQRGAIDALVTSSAQVLHQLGERFSANIDSQTEKVEAMTTQMAGSAIEVASLGEAFGHGVQLFSDSSSALISGLQRIESALGKSTARSDEQLAYYVAQAREIVDLSISSQRQIVEDLQQLARKQAMLSGEAV